MVFLGYSSLVSSNPMAWRTAFRNSINQFTSSLACLWRCSCFRSSAPNWSILYFILLNSSLTVSCFANSPRVTRSLISGRPLSSRKFILRRWTIFLKLTSLLRMFNNIRSRHRCKCSSIWSTFFPSTYTRHPSSLISSELFLQNSSIL